VAFADQEPIDLVYRAYEGCPSERQFVEMVVGRAAKTLVLSERARGRKFYVTVTSQRRETVGKLEIVSAGATAAREVGGANCSEVVSALALFTALAIDPSARIDPKPEPPPPEPPPPETKPPPKPAPTTAPEPAPPPSPVEPEVRPDARDTRRRLPEVIAGARGIAQGGFESGSATPGVSRGGGLFAQLTTAGFGAYRVSGAYFANTETSKASFQFFEGRLDGCPFTARLTPTLVVEPCLGLEVGQVRATAKAGPTLASTTEHRWWVSGDLLGRARFAPIPWIFAELEVGASAPFTRYTFLLGKPNAVQDRVHTVPAVGWVLGLALGARIL
jgi:hypothetical protein